MRAGRVARKKLHNPVAQRPDMGGEHRGGRAFVRRNMLAEFPRGFPGDLHCTAKEENLKIPDYCRRASLSDWIETRFMGIMGGRSD